MITTIFGRRGAAVMTEMGTSTIATSVTAEKRFIGKRRPCDRRIVVSCGRGFVDSNTEDSICEPTENTKHKKTIPGDCHRLRIPVRAGFGLFLSADSESCLMWTRTRSWILWIDRSDQKIQ